MMQLAESSILFLPNNGSDDAFTARMKDSHVVTEDQVIAIDGTIFRGEYNKDKRCGTIHTLVL